MLTALPTTFRCERLGPCGAEITLRGCQTQRAIGREICQDCQDWRIQIAPPKEEDMGEQGKRPCAVCGRVMAIQAYGRCGGCNYWSKKGLPDEQIREKMAGRPSLAEIREKRAEEMVLPPPPCNPANPVPRPHELTINLDMTDHPEILRGVSERARGQFRPVGMQILFELSRNGLVAAEE